MQSPLVTRSAVAPTILSSRQQYRFCHIQVADDGHPHAAIQVSGRFYSLVRVFPERQKALDVGNRLMAKGNQVVITPIAKGDAVWVYESDGIPVPSKRQVRSQTVASLGRSVVSPASRASQDCRVLESRTQYQHCYIRVPDLNMRLAAIAVDNRYYALFKMVDSKDRALGLAARLLRGGDEIVITPVDNGYAVWVYEVEAHLYLE